VTGLSSRLLTSHYQNNYKGAVTRLQAVRGELGLSDIAATPGYRLNGLKREELLARNSVILHELYFACLAGRRAPDSGLSAALEQSFGSVDRWAAEFAAVGKALGGGSGWVILTWDPRDGRLVNSWGADHTMTLAGGTPLVALDMYEHAYHLDFGAKAGAYVDAFMKALDWNYANNAYRRVAALLLGADLR
jgi:Fe-Mn family superoxide dismutase